MGYTNHIKWCDFRARPELRRGPVISACPWPTSTNMQPKHLIFLTLFIFPLKLAHSQKIYSEGPHQNSKANEDASEGHSEINSAHDETDNFIFTTIASLLQQWPNTRYRNGHTIAKGTIPVGTILWARANCSYTTDNNPVGWIDIMEDRAKISPKLPNGSPSMSNIRFYCAHHLNAVCIYYAWHYIIYSRH